MAGTIKFVVISCLVSLLLIDCVLCRHSRAIERKFETDYDDKDVEAESRGIFGWLTAPLPYMGVMWCAEVNNSRGPFGWLSGHAINYRKGFMIMHKATGLLLPIAIWEPPKKALITVPMPAKIDIFKGSDQQRFDEIDVVMRDLADTPFYLTHVRESHKFSKKEQDKYSLGKNIMQTYPEANFDLDGSATEDCAVYTWSDLPDSDPYPKQGLAEDKGARFFVKFPVRKGDCDEKKCIFWSKIDVSEICLGLPDLAAPVLCGPEKKVAFLAAQPHFYSREIVCSVKFIAYRVGPMIKHINDGGCCH